MTAKISLSVVVSLIFIIIGSYFLLHGSFFGLVFIAEIIIVMYLDKNRRCYDLS
jgi:hypothetical protein